MTKLATISGLSKFSQFEWVKLALLQNFKEMIRWS